jgi:hypothetical protein
VELARRGLVDELHSTFSSLMVLEEEP